jgi:hypothetical protein
MKPADKKRLEVWLSQQIHTEQPDGAPLRLFKVSHLVEGAIKKASILEVHYRDQTETASIAAQLIEHAQADADAAGGVQKYEIKAQYGQQQVESRGGRFVMRLKGEAEDTEDEMGLASVETSGRGVLAMVMKHQEGTMRLMVGVVGDLMNSQQTILGNLSARVEKAEARSSSLYELLEKAANDRLDRELAARDQLRKERREDMMINVAEKVLLPKLIQSVGTVDTQMEMLIAGMSEQQLEAIAATLTPEQIPAFVALMKSLDARQKKSKADEAKLEQDKKALLQASEGGGPTPTATIGDIVGGGS